MIVNAGRDVRYSVQIYRANGMRLADHHGDGEYDDLQPAIDAAGWALADPLGLVAEVRVIDTARQREQLEKVETP